MKVKIKKGKKHKKCVIRGKIKFEDYKNCLEATHIENKINYLEKRKLIQKFLKKTIQNL